MYGFAIILSTVMTAQMRKKKTNCVAFLKSTESEICEAVKKNILETKEYFKNKNKIVVRSKIEDLAKKSVIYNRR